MKKITKILVLTATFILISLLPVVMAYAGQLLLKQGMSGDSVFMLQKQLQLYGYYKDGLDGIFGPNTHNAVVNFQSTHNLTVDGIAGQQTLQALNNNGVATTSRGLSEDRQGIVNTAMRLLNAPYVWSGSTPSGFDCSGFTYYVYRQHGISIPRNSFDQFKVGVHVSPPQLGDLVFFSTYQSGASHVGIYIGNNQFIHCSSARENVNISSLSEAYYKARYLGVRSFVR